MPPLPSRVSLPLWPNSMSSPEPPVIVSLPAPPNRLAAGSAPLLSLSVMMSSPPWPNTWIIAGVGDRRRPALDGDGAAVHQDRSGRVAAERHGVVEVVAERGENLRSRIEGRRDGHCGSSRCCKRLRRCRALRARQMRRRCPPPRIGVTVGRAGLVTANAAAVLETRCSLRGIFLEIAGDRAARRPPNGLPPLLRFTFPPRSSAQRQQQRRLART